MRHIHHCFLILSFTLPCALLGKTIRFDMRDAGFRNLVVFSSDALLEKTVGLSNALGGWIELDPEKVADGIAGEFDLDLRTFKTGIAVRDQFLLDKALEATKYPVAKFTLRKLVSHSEPKLDNGQPVTIRVDGDLKVKGKVVSQRVLMKVSYLKETAITQQRLRGNLLKVSAGFDLDGELLDVKVPVEFQSRFTRFVQITVDAVGTDKPPAVVK